MDSKILKWGNSLGVRIPRSLAREAGIDEGSPIEIVVEGGQLIARSHVVRRYRLDDLLRRVTPENRHEPIDTGSPRGGETW